MASYNEGCWEREDANLKVDMVEEEELAAGRRKWEGQQ